MSYIFTGRLRAQTCGGAVVPVANATLMFYRPQDGEEAGFVVHDPEAVRGREFRLFGQARTDENGEFSIDLTRKTIFGHRGSTHPYEGGPFVLDAYVRVADGPVLDHDPEPVQFTLRTVAPKWEETGGSRSMRWEHEIPESEWAQVRSALDTWTIHGRVLRAGNQPAQGLKVFAYDADLVQDDFLGTAITDAEGRFRIDFPGSAFRNTAVPGASFERGGPEVYFRVETAHGTVVYEESKARGNKPDRANVSNCFAAELMVDSDSTATA